MSEKISLYEFESYLNRKVSKFVHRCRDHWGTLDADRASMTKAQWIVLFASYVKDGLIHGRSNGELYK
jgi:hypothetical protein